MDKKIIINILFCFLFFHVLLLPGCTKKESRETKQPLSKKSAKPDDTLKPARKNKGLTELLDKLKQKNPFSRDHTETAKYRFAAGTLILSGIFYDGKKPCAIINEQIVNEGDMIYSKQVIKITPDEVTLRGEAGEYCLRVQ